jgi:hypothetical protein
MSAADVMQFVLVFSNYFFAKHVARTHLRVWLLAFTKAAELLSSTSYTPSEIQ